MPLYPFLPNFAGQIAEAADVPSEIAERYAQAGVQQQTAQQLALSNLLARARLPMQAAAAQYGLGQIQQLQQQQQQEDEIPENSTQGTYLGGEEPETQATSYQEAPSEPNSPLHPMDEDDYTRFRDRALGVIDQQYQPIPAALSPNQASQVSGLGVIGSIEGSGIGPGASGSMREQFLNNQQRQIQQRQITASTDYNAALAVANSTNPREALKTLLADDPSLAQIIPPGLTDQQIRDLAGHIGAELYPYSNRPFHVENGYIIDDKNGKRVLGTGQVGMSQDQLAKAINDAEITHPAYVGNTEAELPAYRLGGYGSAREQVLKSGAMYGGTQPYFGDLATPENPIPQGAESKYGPRPVPTSATAGGTNETAGGNTPPNPPTPQSGNKQQSSGLQLDSANSPDGKVDFTQPGFHPMPKFTNPNSNGVGINPVMEGNLKILQAKQQELSDTMDSTALLAQTNITRDRNLLRLVPKAAFGPGTESGARLQTFLQSFDSKYKLSAADFLKDPTAEQILVKNLTAGGVEQLERAMQQAGGGSIRMGAMMASMISGRMSPNTELTRNAVKTMLQWEIAHNTYDQQMAKDWARIPTRPDNMKVVSPMDWTNAYMDHYPREDAFNRYIKNMNDYGVIKDKYGFFEGSIYKDKNHKQAVYLGNNKFGPVTAGTH